LPNGILISIDTSTINNPSLFTDLNVSIDVEAEVIEASLADMDIIMPDNSIIISPSAKGYFGFEMQIHIPTERAEAAGLTSTGNINLRHVSSFGLVTEAGTIVPKDDGSFVAIIDHSSQFVTSEGVPASEVQLRAISVAELMVQRNTRWEGAHVSPSWVYHYLVDQRDFA
jgi:hypothetical protein